MEGRKERNLRLFRRHLERHIGYRFRSEMLWGKGFLYYPGRDAAGRPCC